MTPDPVGIVEIAERAGVARGTVDWWRGPTGDPTFPAPRWIVGGRGCWDYHRDIEPWLTATGRTPKAK